MEEIVDRFVEKHQLLKEGASVVIAVSGGPDSMALLHYFLKKRGRWRLRLIAAHVNHMLRGTESFEDFIYVKTFCQNCDILFEGTHIDVNMYKEKHGLSTQTAARECRYQFFSDVMNKHKADFLALGHHGDDQIETMLMRQLRGAAGFARAGIPVKRPFAGGMIIRPFLCLEKAEIEHYIEQAGIKPRLDSSNECADYLRNRIRQAVLPFLKRENPRAHERFQQQSELLFEDEKLLMSMAEQSYSKLVKRLEPNVFTVSAAEFLSMAVPLQRRVIQLLLNYLYNSERVDAASIHIDQILRFFNHAKPSGMLHLPAGLRVTRSYDRVAFAFASEQEEPFPFSYDVYLPFELDLPDGAMIGETTDEPRGVNGNPCVFVGDLEQIQLPLTIRTRKSGDRFYPKGMAGSKKVKSIFIDEKIDRSKRDLIPIVEDADGNILWIAGVKRSKFALITEKTKTYLQIVYKVNDAFSKNREDK